MINREPDTSATGHFGTKTLRHHKIGAEVSGHFGTGPGPKCPLDTSVPVPKCPDSSAPKHLDTSAPNLSQICAEVFGHFGTKPLRHFGTKFKSNSSAEVSGHFGTKELNTSDPSMRE